ncbi:MAG: nucleotidyltransferase family protein, partial [Clostridia bacterium]|nr:nucleotidyltransferase family protein [Clostridia bacterium]
MNKEFLNMIKLFAYGATGIEKNIPVEFDFEKVMFYANEQGVWQIVFYAIEQLKKQEKINIDEGFFEFTKMQFIVACLKNSERLSFSHKVIEELTENGVENCVIKGESLSTLYYKPECRVSGDVDLYIG